MTPIIQEARSRYDHAPAASRAHQSAERILAHPPTPAAGYMPAAVHAAAGRLTRAAAWPATRPLDDGTSPAAIHDLLDEWWPRIRTGTATGEEMFKAGGIQLWDAFMTQDPMGVYADLVAAKLHDLTGDQLAHLRVLELGAGIGNTTRLLRGSTLDYLATDLKRFPGVKEWDFDAWQWPPGRCPYPPDVIVATNAAHCSADPATLIARCHDVLAPGGILILGEGYASEAQPWYQDTVCSTLRGWYDRGGFRTDTEWLGWLGHHFTAEHGRVRLYDDSRDLGGVYWGVK